jgi:predicted transcriptional regulator
MDNSISRRLAVKSTVFGALLVSIPHILYSKKIESINHTFLDNKRYPAIAESVVSEVVGLSHFDLEKLRILVNARPELARASWDWGFGDWESAIGAASHVGRKDIIDFLLSKGARPDIFTFATLGSFDTVKAMIEFVPGLQKTLGPHGISLVQHTKNGISAKTGSAIEANKLLDYLLRLGDADGQKYDVIADTDKEKYLGDYKYGEGVTDGFTIRLNMKKLLSIGLIGKFGGALLKTGENKFTYNGAPSVEIAFQFDKEKITSLTIKEPSLTLIAKKI